MKHTLVIAAIAAVSWSAFADGAVSPIEKLKADMVKIPGRQFSLCKYEVTQELWEAVMGDNPSSSKGAGKPVENVYYETCLVYTARGEGVANGARTQDWRQRCEAGRGCAQGLHALHVLHG